LLPENAFDLINGYFNNINNKICRFKLGFDINHWFLDRFKTYSNFDTKFTRFGDMFIAVRKNYFNEIGGYPNWKTFEDVEFLRIASAKTKIGILNSEVISSARTFTKFGLINQQIYNGYLMTKYLLGFRNFIVENRYYEREQKQISASIILFLKYPVKGKVKTRLAKTIGDEKAVRLYKKLSENIIATISKLSNSHKYIFYSEKEEKDLINNWIKDKCFFAAQDGEDLGKRMKNAFNQVFSHGARKVIILGSDIPDLSKEIIEEAISKLDENDIVIGPSPDGGYYLLGMKKYSPFLFDNIIYSTNSVLEETIGKIKKKKLSYHILQTLEDIDTEDELKEWLKMGKNKNLQLEIIKIYN
jgi:rSAM/selenodomain-associated transferase 1